MTQMLVIFRATGKLCLTYGENLLILVLLALVELPFFLSTIIIYSVIATINFFLQIIRQYIIPIPLLHFGQKQKKKLE